MLNLLFFLSFFFYYYYYYFFSTRLTTRCARVFWRTNSLLHQRRRHHRRHRLKSHSRVASCGRACRRSTRRATAQARRRGCRRKRAASRRRRQRWSTRPSLICACRWRRNVHWVPTPTTTCVSLRRASSSVDRALARRRLRYAGWRVDMRAIGDTQRLMHHRCSEGATDQLVVLAIFFVILISLKI